MGCCNGKDCDCYIDGYDDGVSDAESPDPSFVEQYARFNMKDVQVLPFHNSKFIARIGYNYPEGIGNTEEEALGNLLKELLFRNVKILIA